MTVYLLCYIAAFLLSGSGYHVFAGLGLLSAAIYLYWKDYQNTGNVIHLRGIYSLSFVGGQGLSAMKLSYISQEWSSWTWITLFAAYTGFYAVFQWLDKRAGAFGSNVRNAAAKKHKVHSVHMERMAPAVFLCAGLLTMITSGFFLLEAYTLGFLPLLIRGVPHAYSEFHITGIHYFTVCCVLVPALSVIYFCLDRGRSRGKTVLLILMDVIALGIPILCVSRFQMLFAILLAVLVYFQMEERVNLYYAGAALVLLIVLYVILTIARSHDVEYLNAVFEMKNAKMPIFITQPYMYISNNYDNFDLLVQGIEDFTWGKKMMTPLWVLSGLKFLFPSLMAAPVFVTKAELTTLTLYYDAYCDFGLVGVLLFSCLLGAFSYWLTQKIPQWGNPIVYLFYAQIAVYLLLSFFTTWFSNPTTWFYLAATAAMAIFTELISRHSGRRPFKRNKYK